jgi:Cys-tRNA(Pro) deacylase
MWRGERLKRLHAAHHPREDGCVTDEPGQDSGHAGRAHVAHDNGVDFTHHLYTYEERAGPQPRRGSRVDEHTVIRDVVMEDDAKRPLIVLMHGDREVSTKNLARQIGVKSVQPCAPAVADRHSGYQVGGTSPFGTRRKMPVYMERTIADLPTLFVNGGKRGYLVGMSPPVVRVLADAGRRRHGGQ